MKNTYLFILFTGLILAGCTSKEQDEKIRAFWGQQFLQAAKKNPELLQKAMPLSMAQSAAARPQAVQVQTQVVLENTSSTPTPPANPVAKTPRATPVQVLDVMVEEDVLPGKASQAERIRMTQAWNEVQDNNQSLLKDLQSAFGEDVKTSAFYITLTTERKLKKAAAVATNYQDYLARQKQILAEQDQSIQQLMQQNTASLRRIKKSSTAK